MLREIKFNQVLYVLNIVYRNRRYQRAALASGVISFLVFSWFLQPVVPGNGFPGSINLAVSLQALILATNVGIMTPLLSYIFKKRHSATSYKGIVSQEQDPEVAGPAKKSSIGAWLTGGGLTLALACVGCCLPVIGPILLAIFAGAGGLGFSLINHPGAGQYNSLFFLGIVLLWVFTLILFVRTQRQRKV